MSVLVNPQTNEVHEFSPEESQKLLQQGWLVPLINREGIPEAIPYHEGQDYLSQGYQNPNDNQLNELLHRTKYTQTGQKVAAFAEGAAKGLSGPGYAAIAPFTGLTTREDIKGREQYNPELSTAGDITGTVGGALAGVGLPGLIGKAGAAAGVAGKVFGAAGRMAAKGAAEAALYTAADHINERLLGDPEAVGESLMGHIGLSALLGGGAGLAFAPLTSAISRAGTLTQKATQKLAENDKIVGKVAEKAYDTLVDFAPIPGFARVAARGAKKAVVNSILALAPEKQTILDQLSHLGDLASKANSVLEKKASGIFASQIEKSMDSKQTEYSTEEPKVHGIGTMVMDHANDPEKLINQMNNATMIMASAAPDTAMALSANVARAVQFLASKVPTPQQAGFLDSPQPPKRSEIQQFNRYAQVVENPLSVLEHVKAATLLPQDLEALSAVYPAMYQSMKATVMDKLISKMGKQKSLHLPYAKRMSLSLFLGSPLDSSLAPNAVASNQQSFNTMQLQKQMQNQIQRVSKTGMQRMDPTRDLTRAQRAISRR